ncbi:MAG: radical SAM protein [Bacteroidota bacterium]
MIKIIKKSILSRVTNKIIRNDANNKRTNDLYSPLDDSLVKEYNRVRQYGPQDILCYAPYKNIHFGFDGKATACCYNREHVLGTYPEQSIKEIWFGKKTSKLREYIKHNDLSLGCIGCKHHFEARDFGGVQAIYFDQNPPNITRYPCVMSFELDNVCNLECEMCNGDFSSLIRKNRDKKQPLENPYNDEFLNQLIEFIPHLHCAKFYGGEPFLVDLYYRIWDMIIKINPCISIEVQTSATILNNRVKEILNRGWFNINISIDSLHKETYESIRKNARYEMVMRNIKFFANYCQQKKTKLLISGCPMRQNWKELPDLIHFCNELGARVYFHLVWSPGHCALWNMDTASLKNIISYLSGFRFPQKNAIQKDNSWHYFDMINLIKSWHEAALGREEEARKQEEEARKQEEEARKQREIAAETGRRKKRFMPSVKSIGAKETLYNEIKDHVFRGNKLSEEEKRNLTKNYISQMNWVFEHLPGSYPAGKVYESLLFERPLENIIRELEKNDREKLLVVAQRFIDKNLIYKE